MAWRSATSSSGQLSGFLPEEIIAKKKQGFGLPVSIWLRSHPGLRELVRDTIFSTRARARGYFNHSHVESLLARHDKGSWGLTPMEIFLDS